MANAAMGRFRKKIHRQLSASVRMPPSSGPMALPKPAAPRISPPARPALLLPASKAGLAGGLILGAAGFGNAIGPLLGGILTDALSWRWIFFLNLPIAAFAMLVTWRVVHEDEATVTDHRIDYGGVATLTIGLFALLLALDQGTDLGWTDP